MIDFTQKLHAELLLKLENLDANPPVKKYIVDERLELIITSLNLILQKLKDHQFANEKEEIRFFKSVLPPNVSLLFYYAGKIDREAVDRLGTQKAKHDFIE